MWTYDNAGNILSRKEYAYTTGTVGTATDTVTYTYGDSTWGDLLTGYDGKTITYEADKNIGNPLSDGTWTYTWEHGRELASMTDGTTTWTYTYDANGMRTSRSNGTTTYKYVYNGGSLVQMTVGDDTLYFTSDTVTYNGIVYYYVTNLQGDVTAIINSSGALAVLYTYDAWGNILNIDGTMADTLGVLNPIRYRGYVYDQESTLYYLQSRYYDPEIGRFLNADALVSTGQGILGNNMFAYCGNNPITYSDPSGHRRDLIFPCVRPEAPYDPTNPYRKTEGLIYGQANCGYEDCSFGYSTLKWSGCLIIAMYNALQLYDQPKSLGLIADEFWYCYKEYVLLDGVAGVSPNGVAAYLNANGIPYEDYVHPYYLHKDITEGDIIIFTIMNDIHDITAGFHTMTAQYIGGEYMVYNQYNNGTRAYPVASLFDIYENSLFIIGYVIGG